MKMILTLKLFWKRFFINAILVSGVFVLFLLFFNFVKIIFSSSNQQVSAQVQEGQEPLGFEDLVPSQDGQEPLEDNSDPLVRIRQRIIVEGSTEPDIVPTLQEGQTPLEDTVGPAVPAFQEGQAPIQPPHTPPVIIEQPPVIIQQPASVEAQRIVEQPVVIQQPQVQQASVQQPVIVSSPQQPPPPSNPVIVQSPSQQPDVQQVSTDVDNTIRNDIVNNNINSNTNTNNQTVSVGSTVPAVAPAVAPAPVAVERVVTTPVTVAKAPVVEVEALPKTGPPVPFWIGLGAVPFGFMLRRFAKIKKLAENGYYFFEQKQFTKKYFTP